MKWHEFSSPVAKTFNLTWNELPPPSRWNENYTAPEIFSTSGITGNVTGFLEFFTHTVSGLKSNQHYIFRINAVNVAGPGPVSDDTWLATSKRNK